MERTSPDPTFYYNPFLNYVLKWTFSESAVFISICVEHRFFRIKSVAHSGYGNVQIIRYATKVGRSADVCHGPL